MLVPDKYTGANTVYAVLNSVLKSTKDGDDVLKVKGFTGSKEVTWYTDDETCGDLNKNYNVKTQADYESVYELTLNAAGVITGAVALNDGSAANDDRETTVKGNVDDKKDSSLKINGTWINFDDAVVQYYTYDKGDQEFSAAKIGDVNKAKNGESGSYVWAWQADEDSDAYDFVVIFKDAKQAPDGKDTVKTGVVTYIDATGVIEIDGAVYSIADSTVLRNELGIIEKTGKVDINTRISALTDKKVFDVVANSSKVISSLKYVAETADKNAANTVIAAINALATSTDLATDVPAARGDYNGLATQVQKDLVPASVLAKLVAEENKLANAADAASVATDKAALTVGFAGGDSATSVISNVTLNAGPLAEGSTVSWASSDTATITTLGVVTRPAYTVGDKTVKLTATLTNGAATATKEFMVTVKALDATPAETRLAAVNTATTAAQMRTALEALITATELTPGSYSSLISAQKDMVAQTVLNARPTAGFANVAAVQTAFDAAL